MIGVLSAEAVKRKKDLSDESYELLKTSATQIGIILDEYLRKK